MQSLDYSHVSEHNISVSNSGLPSWAQSYYQLVWVATIFPKYVSKWENKPNLLWDS